ncbi:unnamed protein product [Rotaria magnacalcarata]|uniref:Activating signal cointegrator 1 complex subunit 3 n=1 Tax=Rotaria magnacalcarata TaxID=392030 RepID=A0A816NI68_9BILA|nr:unnamed protein product [Rotaria magnacalcarata]CAF3805007.1 unnamed protein product [Rotaria magnacalcarata]
MIDYRTYPRITGSLRAHSDIAERLHYRGDTDELLRRRQQSLNTDSRKTITWHELQQLFLKNNSNSAIESQIKQLRKYAIEFVGSESDSSSTDSVCIYLFESFRNVNQIQVSLLKELKLRFPTYTQQLVTQTFELIRSLIHSLKPSFDEEYSSRTSSKTSSKQLFGEATVFHPVSIQINEPLPWLDRLSYDFAYKEQENINNEETWTEALPTAAPTAAASSIYTKKWLENRLRTVLEARDGENVLGPQEFCNLVFETLVSNSSDDEIQHSLCDIVGYEHIELISELIQNRQMIIDGILTSAKARPREIVRAPELIQRQAQPIHGLTIVVHSEQEKRLGKLIRKQDRKQQQQSPQQQLDDSLSEFANPDMLRYERERQLLLATEKRYEKLSNLSQPRSNRTPTKFPFVFDQLQEIKQKTAYIGGHNLLLPENIERKSTTNYDLVHIPHGEQIKLANLGKNVCPALVRFEDLEPLGQILFKDSIKTLNLVQSIVYRTAVFSNENILISAPTGAGKTNIAMLTILSELRRHYDVKNNVLLDTDFKIIYVAPMKALASEMVQNFSQRLSSLGLQVKELTGDMQLTKAEIERTHMIITTPEKWDVVTRKSTGDTKFVQSVKLLIIDEIHLLHEDRGPVIEALVARTLRQVEQTQESIRIVGLSATLPNYIDIARFLFVNLMTGLFFFDHRFRPVPLSQTFIGIKGANKMATIKNLDDVCYDKVLEQIKVGRQQVLVFVHARNATVRTGLQLVEYARNRGDLEYFLYKAKDDDGQQESRQYQEACRHVSHSKNVQLRDLFPNGIGIHHAGMLRQDRNLVEKYFSKGFIKVLVCTATLAWGVNLPAHAVIIKGTELYDSKRGSFVDLSILDVLQIFGRAGRPQFDTNGHGIILTTYEKLQHYLSLLTRQNPIESQFISHLTDNLNAEVVLGTVATVNEACSWLRYTYLNVRMHASPITYGINANMYAADPMLHSFQRDLIAKVAQELDKAHMVRFEEKTGYLFATDLGRTASHYYINYVTIETINERLSNRYMSEAELIELASLADEFSQLKVRDDELYELDLLYNNQCRVPVKGGVENVHGKTNILIQAYISRAQLHSFSLVSDMSYVNQNVVRLIRALFEVVLKRSWATLSSRSLRLAKMVEQRMWDTINPLWQFSQYINVEILQKLDEKKMTPERLLEMDAKEIGIMIHNTRLGKEIKAYASYIPLLKIETQLQPITRTVLRIKLTITAAFKWSDKIHGTNSQQFWIWIEDPDTDNIYHSEYFIITKKQVKLEEPQTIIFTIPIIEPLANQYYVRAISDRWLGSDTATIISFHNLILPERHMPHTELLDLEPLPITALGNPAYEALFEFKHFNPIQTQLFHCLYHTNNNTLLGSPTGSGKTVAAEIAMFRVFNKYPDMKCVYIAPLKALVRERIHDWKIRLEQRLGKKVVELTGDFTPDTRAIQLADVIVTTPEKWDGMSRSWQTRSYIKQVALLIIDEIHMLGEDRGPVLEVIVSRANFIASHTDLPLRIVGLSTAVANARDLADWLGITGSIGLYNFRPSVRPVPLEAHIQGYPGKNYCPRCMSMNKPAYQAIRTHSPDKPVLIFVSSRRQTRLTAEELTKYLLNDDHPKQWLHLPEVEMNNILEQIQDKSLRMTLAFGVGIHHAGLKDRDRDIVEKLFVNRKIQILVATSTLAWGVNFPAHLVIIKGTEYYDGKTHRYVDFPITDVLQMMGRAGRPQFDDSGKAVIMVHDVKKNFYKKFLYEPFPVESSLLNVLSDHLNAEIVSGTISTKQEALDYLTWTYFFRRLLVNPSYYQMEPLASDANEQVTLNTYLSTIVQRSLDELIRSTCVLISEDDQRTLQATVHGRIASHYYISYKTINMFAQRVTSNTTIADLIDIISSAHEYAEMPVRHNEDELHKTMVDHVRIPFQRPPQLDSPHLKTNLLIQFHLSRLEFPRVDYVTDLKSCLDQIVRVIQALIDLCAYKALLSPCLLCIHFLQMIIQARWITDPDVLTLPHIIDRSFARIFSSRLCQLTDIKRETLNSMIQTHLTTAQIDDIYEHLMRLPQIELTFNIRGFWSTRVETRQLPANVHADQEYTLQIALKRINRIRRNEFRQLTTSSVNKPKDESWIFVLGNSDTGELICIKRFNQIIRSHTTVSLSFVTSNIIGRQRLTLYLLSDGYLGLDQQYDFFIDVQSASLQTQINTELNALSDELDRRLAVLQ